MSLRYSKSQIVDFTILVLRWYLAVYMFTYGWGKLTGWQFGISNMELLEKPLKEVDRFYLAWYLFSLSKSFNIVVGLLQIIGSILVVINRTVILGVFFLIPILFQILLIDISFTTNYFGAALPLRLTMMLVSSFVILWYYFDPIKSAMKTLTTSISTKFKYR
ncbi:MAG TPA: DoxX family membrane protein, partial [Bacteroidia bacterium]|nr:DoxX family membrane protein [Bacteroidia bacterium]